MSSLNLLDYAQAMCSASPANDIMLIGIDLSMGYSLVEASHIALCAKHLHGYLCPSDLLSLSL